MKTTKGLFLDTVAEDTPPGYLTFAKNVLLTEKLGIIQNEKGFLHHITIPDTIIGVLPVLDRVVLWTVGNGGLSSVGYLSYDSFGVVQYTKVVDDTMLIPAGSKLNFNLLNPIDAEFHINAAGEVVVAWIDELNTPKILNIDKPSFQANDLELFPAARLSTPRVDVLQFGGNLPSGVYKITYYFEDDDGSTSNFAALSKPVGIIKDPNSNPPDQVWGVAAATNTTKAISITVSVDTNWSFINFCAVRTINGITSVVKFKRAAVTPIAPQVTTLPEMTVIYTGAEPTETISLNEVLTPHAYYINARAITQLNNRLYLGNLTTADEFRIQQTACNVKISWRSQRLNVDGAAEREGSGYKYETFAHGEVYAMYLQVRDAKTGVWSKGFHIPGRPLAGNDPFGGGDLTPVTPSPGGAIKSGANSPPFKQYQLEDTVTVTQPLGPGNIVLGTMGYWANENETYPNDPSFNGKLLDPTGVDLTPIAGVPQKVRHHKFPTFKYTRNKHGNDPYFGANHLDRLTIDVANVKFPANLNGKISAWRICYAKRDLANATVLGMGGVFFFGMGENPPYQLKPLAANGTTRQASGGHPGQDSNAIIIAQQGIEALTATMTSDGAQFVRFHAFNLMVDKPSIAPTYLRSEWKIMYTSQPGPTGFNANNDPRIVKSNSIQEFRKWMLYDPRIINKLITNGDPYRFRNVSFVQYLASGAIVQNSGFTINNICGEECLLLKHNVAGLTPLDKTMNLMPSHTDQNWVGGDQTSQGVMISTLCTLKTDIYISFDAQNLVATDVVKELDPTSVTTITGVLGIGGGDNWLGLNSTHLQGPVGDLDESGTTGQELQGVGTKGVHMFAGECPKNLNYRYSDVANPQSQFYDQSPLRPKIATVDYATLYLGNMNLRKTPVYLYNPDYNKLNDLGNNMEAFDHTIDTETEFPTTVARSIANLPESNVVNWKTFLISDRYTMPRNKGVIENLQGVGNQRLFIHHTDSLYITKDRTTLQGNIADVTLGSGDIFEVTPFEVLSSDQGYAGTQHKFACLSSKVGYIFPDASQGKIFIHDGEKLEEISKQGMRQFWRDHLNKDLPDNPFYGNGISVAYDETYNRVVFALIDKRATSTTPRVITATYSPQLEAWASFHDYEANYVYSTRSNRTFSIETLNPGGASRIFQHNVGPYGRYYQDLPAVPYPMIIELLYNDAGYVTKYFKAIDWISHVLNQSNAEIQLETFDFITARSSTKGTGRIPVIQYTELVDAHVANTRFTEKSWGFNQFRNQVKQNPGVPILLPFSGDFALNPAAIDPNKDWYEQGRLVDTYLAVRLEYMNKNNNKFLLLDHSMDFRQSIR